MDEGLKEVGGLADVEGGVWMGGMMGIACFWFLWIVFILISMTTTL